MIHKFSLPQLLLQSLTLSFDIHLFPPFIPLEQQKGFGRWYLTISVHFAPNLISSASPSFAPQPPSPVWCIHVCSVSSYSHRDTAGSGRVWPMPRSRMGSISTVGCQGLRSLCILSNKAKEILEMFSTLQQ